MKVHATQLALFMLLIGGLAGCGGPPQKDSSREADLIATGTPVLSRPAGQNSSSTPTHPNLVIVNLAEGAKRFTPVMPVDGKSQAVHDGETGLTWELVAGGAHSSPRTMMPVTSPSWYVALDLCYSSVAGGRFGWRLPEIHELASLKLAGNSGHGIPLGHPFKIGPGLDWENTLFWSATEFRREYPGVTAASLASETRASDAPSIKVWALQFGAAGPPEPALKIATTKKRESLVAAPTTQVPYAMAVWCVRDD